MTTTNDGDPDFGFLNSCLYFNANRLSRAITRMAEEEFAITGLSPMYGYLIRLVNGMPGITQKELADQLYIAPSTVTRFIDKLAGRGLVERSVNGKTVNVHPTSKGLEMEETIRKASRNFAQRYEEILGREMAKELSRSIENTSGMLEKFN